MSGYPDWDIVTGVGLTALGVAAGRAIETHRAPNLVADPYAEAFVQAARAPLPFPTRLDAADDAAVPWRPMSTYMGVRSRFFDEFFASAAQAGLRQVVLLAAGLDSRAFRLDWPPGTVLYELDAPRVLEFKDSVLEEQQAQPRCGRRTVGSDLREDWPAALRQAGFEPGLPTAWLAEGLLPFLPDDAKDRLFTRMHELSAPGSRLAAEHIDADMAALLDQPMFRDMADRFGFDLAELWPADQNYDPVGWLTGHGWAVTTDQAAAVAEGYGRPLDDAVLQPMPSSVLITAHAPADRPGPGPRPREETTPMSAEDPRPAAPLLTAMDRTRDLLRPDVPGQMAGGYLDTLAREPAPAARGAQSLWQTGFGSDLWRRLQPALASSLMPSYRSVARELRLQPGDTVVDVGCGPGNVTVALADAVAPGGLAVGVDMSAPMLAHAVGQARPNMGLVRADAQDLPLREASADAACATAVIMLVPDAGQALAEMTRILRPGGSLLVMVPCRPTGLTAPLTRPLTDLLGRVAHARMFGSEEIPELLDGLGYDRIRSHVHANMVIVRARKAVST